MLTCCSFPTESLRILALVTLLLFEIVWLTKKNRRAALVLAAGCVLDLISAFGAPILELFGFYLMGNNVANEGFLIAGLFTIPMLQRLSMACHVIAILTGLAMLTRDLPDEERDGSW